MKRIIRVATALYHTFFNMRQYPGLFAVLNRSVGLIPDHEAAFIAQAIADNMEPEQVSVILDIIDKYTAIPDGPITPC